MASLFSTGIVPLLLKKHLEAKDYLILLQAYDR